MPPEQKENLAERLQRLRREKGWTQAELAEKAGVPKPSVINYELGHRGMSGLAAAYKLAKALEVPLEMLGEVAEVEAVKRPARPRGRPTKEEAEAARVPQTEPSQIGPGRGQPRKKRTE